MARGPIRCPACDAMLREHTELTDDDWEYWSYDCGAAIIFNTDIGRFEALDDCGRALETAVKKFNAATVR